MKKAFMLAVTKDYVFAAGNVVLSLKKYMPENNYDIIIYYDEIDDYDKSILEEYHCILKKYEINSAFKKKIVSQRSEFLDINKQKHFSFLKFAKFEIFSLLNEYDKVVWLDADIAVQDSLSDIFHYDCFAISQDADYTVQNNFLSAIYPYDMDKKRVCTSVFLVSKSIGNFSHIKDWCYSKTAELAPFLKNIDQGIFNLLLQEYKIAYTFLDERVYNCFSQYPMAHIAKIVHFGTPQKVWNNSMLASSFPEWFRTYKKWISLGGTSCSMLNFDVINSCAKFIYKDNIINQQKNKLNILEREMSDKKNDKKIWKYFILSIPLIKIIKKSRYIKVYLFNFLPLIKIVRNQI